MTSDIRSFDGTSPSAGTAVINAMVFGVNDKAVTYVIGTTAYVVKITP